MFRMIAIGIDTFSAGIVFIPVFLWLWKVRYHNARNATLAFVFYIYLAAMFSAVGIPCITDFHWDVAVNVIPFAGIVSAFSNAVLNVILFIPLGVFLPLMGSKFKSCKSVFLTGVALSMLIELLQLFTFRTTDVNDLITNSLGCILGYGLSIPLTKFLPHLCKPTEDQYAVYYLTGIAFLSVLFATPFISALIWPVFL